MFLVATHFVESIIDYETLLMIFLTVGFLQVFDDQYYFTYNLNVFK